MSLPIPGAAPFHLLALGPFPPDHIRASLISSKMARNAETDRLIADAWAQCSVIAAERGQSLFAGSMCRLHGWEIVDGELRLSFGRTDYRELVGTNIAHPEIGLRL